MSKFDELIQQLCPDGVEYKPLGEVFKSIKTGKLNANAMTVDGEYPFFTCDEKPYTIDTFAFDTEAIIISGNGSQVGHISYYNGKFNAYQRTYVLSCLEEGSIFYCFHYLKAYLREYIYKFAKKGSVPYITLPMLEGFLIPLPPLPVQEEIVRILDTFTESTNNLKEQIQTRRKQYEYYRNQLLDLEGKDGGGMKTLGEVCGIRKERISSIELSEKNYVSVENLLKDKAGRIDSENIPKEGNWSKYCIGDILIGNIRPYLKKIWLADRNGGTNGDVIVISPKDGILPKYLYNILSSENFFVYYNQTAKGGKMPRGDKKQILVYPVCLHSYSEQLRIVSILDQFEASIANLEAQLKQREKQYEYYRNQLLDFKKKEE